MSDDAYLIDSNVYVPNPVPHNPLFDDPGEIARVLAATKTSIEERSVGVEGTVNG